MADYSQYSDQELFLLLEKDDKHAFTAIYERYERLLYIHAYKRIRNRETSRDVMQDVFSNLWNKRKDVYLTTSPRAYLFTAIRNRIFDLAAKDKLATNYLDSLTGYLVTHTEGTDHRTRINQLQALIDKEIAELPEKMRKIFELSRNEQLSHKEIAAQLDISEGTVKKQVQNALKVLKGKMGPLFILIFF